jgi:predicted Fe-Mo cluster-binding NifX family protein
MENYIVVLFKDKKKKRIIKKFITFSRAKQFYEKLIKESNEVLFEIRVEAGKECNYELGIVEMSSKQLVPVYMTDEFGRSVKVKLDEDGMTLFKIQPYKKEETIYDIKEGKKITMSDLIKKYMKGDGLKMISVLNNKIVLQEDEKIHLFTLKSESESSRFIDSMSLHFFKIKRGDCLFVKDYSTAQRKYLYSLLESNGIDKKILYRKFTTLPQSK